MLVHVQFSKLSKVQWAGRRGYKLGVWDNKMCLVREVSSVQISGLHSYNVMYVCVVCCVHMSCECVCGLVHKCLVRQHVIVT